MRTFLLSCCLLCLPALAVESYLIQSGPMIGHVDDDEVRIWLRAKQGAVISGILRREDAVHRPARIEDLGAGFRVLHFQGLEPESDYRARVELSRLADDPEVVSLRVRTAPPGVPSGRVRVAFGSCSKLSMYDSGRIYKAMVREHPDMAIFVGDNSYFIVGDGSDAHFGTTGPKGDWNTIEGMIHRHLITRNHPDLRNLFRRIPNYAVWDDHDYGPNNADRTFPLKEEALLAFRRMWANPDYGTPTTPGIFSTFRHGPVLVFLMDDRYHKYSPQRHKDTTPEEGHIWGPEQVDWLLDGLLHSDAPVKLVANGTQVLSRSESGESHYNEAIDEIERVLSFVEEHRIGGIVFLTGDRHYSEALQQKQPAGALIAECTSSPLQQNQKVGPFDRNPHDNRLWSMIGNNFGLVTVDLQGPSTGTITFETRNESNQICVVEGALCRTTWSLADLQYPAP